MAKKKKAAAVSEHETQTAAEWHEAARVARRAGDDAESDRCRELAVLAEAFEAKQ